MPLPTRWCSSNGWTPEALLEEEVRAGWGRVGVVVCGPAGLCDATRAAVVRLGRRHETVFELEVDAFGW